MQLGDGLCSGMGFNKTFITFPHIYFQISQPSSKPRQRARVAITRAVLHGLALRADNAHRLRRCLLVRRVNGVTGRLRHRLRLLLRLGLGLGLGRSLCRLLGADRIGLAELSCLGGRGLRCLRRRGRSCNGAIRTRAVPCQDRAAAKAGGMHWVAEAREVVVRIVALATLQLARCRLCSRRVRPGSQAGWPGFAPQDTRRAFTACLRRAA